MSELHHRSDEEISGLLNYLQRRTASTHEMHAAEVIEELWNTRTPSALLEPVGYCSEFALRALESCDCSSMHVLRTRHCIADATALYTYPPYTSPEAARVPE